MQYMRDTFFKEIYERMALKDNIVFLTADVGSPVIDSIKKDFSKRFINVGIAEQNMINVAGGLAMEGFEVYAYGIASFFLRCIDQIRNSLLLSNQMSKLNVNLLATGKGVSYETAGPAHHCLEDLPVLDVFPGVELFIPSDSLMSKAMASQLAVNPGVKYFCFEGKKTGNIYRDDYVFDFLDGYIEHTAGQDVCIISQSSVINLAVKTADFLNSKNINPGIIDVFTSLKSLNTEKLTKILAKYSKIVVLEEGYREKGLLNYTMKELLRESNLNTELFNFGCDDRYIFEVGPRDMHYDNCGLSVDNVFNAIS